MNPNIRRSIACLLIASITLLGTTLPAHAGTVYTEDALGAPRGRIAAALDRSDVQEQLIANGVSPAEVKARVAALTDEEAAQLATRIRALPAGGTDPVTGIATAVMLLGMLGVLAVGLVVMSIAAIGKKLAPASQYPQEGRVDDSHPYRGPAQEPKK